MLSAGGEDAETLREFDLKTGKFVDHGFVSPHSKQAVSWLDKDHSSSPGTGVRAR